MDEEITVGIVVKWAFWTFAALFFLVMAGCAFGVITLPFSVVNSGTTVARRIIDPDNALMQYRYFHDANARLQVFPAQIHEAEENLHYAEAHTPERASARMTELTGIKQVCQSLVADYNSRASRLDAGIFKNPEHYLPISTEAYEPLPVSYSPSYCQGENQ